MKMFKSLTIVLVGILAVSQLQAQSIKTLTLKEALELGYANSKQLAISKEKIKEAQAKLDDAKSKIIPEVGVSGTYLHLNTPNVSMPGSSEGGSSGGSMSALSNLHDIGLAQISASMPIFTGWKLKNNMVMNDYLHQAAEYDAQTTHSEVAMNTIRALYQYYELLESRKTIQENLKGEQQRVAEFKNLEGQGLLARNDRLKAELQANNVELALTEVNNSVKLTEYNLTILLGLPEDSSIQLDTTGMFNVNGLMTWEDYLQAGLTNRTELKAADLEVKASNSGYKMSKSGIYPTVALSAGYVNAYIPNIFTITNAANAGLSLKYSITGAINARHHMHEARARYDQAVSATGLETDKIKVEIRGNFLNSQKLQEKLVINQRAIEQAEENLVISKNRYDQGLLILSDYLEADVALLRARIAYTNTKADLMVAYYELQKSTGTLQ